MDDVQFAQLLEVYEGDLRLLNNDVCRECRPRIPHPLAVWHIGQDFAAASIRILFVGKPHRGIEGGIPGGTTLPSGLIDARRLVERELRWKSWPYWSYTLDIARIVHGSTAAGWNRIAMTNLVKCTNVCHGEDSSDASTLDMTRRCVLEVGVLTAELEILRPTHVIFYTASFFPEVLLSASLGATTSWQDVTNERRPCGKKLLPWRHRVADTPWASPMNVLITGHPERMNRLEYTNMIADWVARA